MDGMGMQLTWYIKVGIDQRIMKFANNSYVL